MLPETIFSRNTISVRSRAAGFFKHSHDDQPARVRVRRPAIRTVSPAALRIRSPRRNLARRSSPACCVQGVLDGGIDLPHPRRNAAPLRCASPRNLEGNHLFHADDARRHQGHEANGTRRPRWRCCHEHLRRFGRSHEQSPKTVPPERRSRRRLNRRGDNTDTRSGSGALARAPPGP